ncbi:flagellin N-terminal helical domain-containing protein [Guptibacillus hwajinpoensis]|uniref:Flagellin n=1 Tax=Guptibacillus hwajinpoensis TaxID=208199 RepID=A0ABU0JYR0_9BACL|nr:flagellin [Alkalihalobacillus hemicentroti]MDQ0482221.1 flagellin [Alkalihalobacillus hemicentroti]
MIINHNISAMNTYRQMGTNQSAASNSMEKLASGLRINKASDDAAGLSISEKMRGQIRGLDQASRNAQDGISLIQTAEGALSETQNMLQRMRELSVQGANDTNTADDRLQIQKEVSQLKEEINRISDTTEFNTKKLLTGSLGVKSNDGTSITGISTTSSTKAGTLNLTANATLATAANGTLTTAANETTANANGTLDITSNGQTFNISFSAGQSYEEIAKNITNTVNGLEAEFKLGTGFKFNSTEANADQSFTVSERNANTLDSTSDFTSGTGTGNIDTAAGSRGINGTNATGLTATGASFSYQGDKVTVTSGNFQGLSFTLKADSPGGSTATTNGSSITVNDSLSLQIGANAEQEMSVSINSVDANTLGISGLDVSTKEGASNAISALDNALKNVSGERAKIGSYQNRLEHTINNLNTSSENLTAAESRIRDVDMAKEMMNMSKENIKAQAAQAMLAQANQQPQQVLQLLR